MKNTELNNAKITMQKSNQLSVKIAIPMKNTELTNAKITGI